MVLGCSSGDAHQTASARTARDLVCADSSPPIAFGSGSGSCTIYTRTTFVQHTPPAKPVARATMVVTAVTALTDRQPGDELTVTRGRLHCL